MKHSPQPSLSAQDGNGFVSKKEFRRALPLLGLKGFEGSARERLHEEADRWAMPS